MSLVAWLVLGLYVLALATLGLGLWTEQTANSADEAAGAALAYAVAIGSGGLATMIAVVTFIVRSL